ncbi:hypothetical protein [Dokdonella fugitiva]|uniref:hypothetical protein n=1 Tax=Dokdonella fugitiva TaxID=328517 RepID=UPI0015F9F9DA|nr:hypothetical protein [Dokdonella fugitiva]MBA8882459.1 hypothetical protein [Dokdonella fugitiva]
MTETDLLQKRKTQVLAAVFGVSLVVGGLLAAQHADLFANPAAVPAAMESIRGSGLNLAYQFAVLLLCFAWLEMDSRQLGIRRPWWLNLGVVFLTSLFVPYYLYKTRAPGQRGGAVLAYFGVLCGSVFAMLAGMLLAASFFAAPPPGKGI